MDSDEVVGFTSASGRALLVLRSTATRDSGRGAGFRVFRDLAGSASKPSVFNKAARFAGAGGNGMDGT
jgi:hypothetical protein